MATHHGGRAGETYFVTSTDDDGRPVEGSHMNLPSREQAFHEVRRRFANDRGMRGTDDEHLYSTENDFVRVEGSEGLGAWVEDTSTPEYNPGPTRNADKSFRLRNKSLKDALKKAIRRPSTGSRVHVGPSQGTVTAEADGNDWEEVYLDELGFSTYHPPERMKDDSGQRYGDDGRKAMSWLNESGGGALVKPPQVGHRKRTKAVRQIPAMPAIPEQANRWANRGIGGYVQGGLSPPDLLGERSIVGDDEVLPEHGTENTEPDMVGEHDYEIDASKKAIHNVPAVAGTPGQANRWANSGRGRLTRVNPLDLAGEVYVDDQEAHPHDGTENAEPDVPDEHDYKVNYGKRFKVLRKKWLKKAPGRGQSPPFDGGHIDPGWGLLNNIIDHEIANRGEILDDDAPPVGPLTRQEAIDRGVIEDDKSFAGRRLGKAKPKLELRHEGVNKAGERIPGQTEVFALYDEGGELIHDVRSRNTADRAVREAENAGFDVHDTHRGATSNTVRETEENKSLARQIKARVRLPGGGPSVAKFTGTVKDSQGRTICFRNGKRVPCPKKQKQPAKEREPAFREEEEMTQAPRPQGEDSRTQVNPGTPITGDSMVESSAIECEWYLSGGVLRVYSVCSLMSFQSMNKALRDGGQLDPTQAATHARFQRLFQGLQNRGEMEQKAFRPLTEEDRVTRDIREDQVEQYNQDINDPKTAVGAVRAYGRTLSPLIYTNLEESPTPGSEPGGPLSPENNPANPANRHKKELAPPKSQGTLLYRGMDLSSAPELEQQFLASCQNSLQTGTPLMLAGYTPCTADEGAEFFGNVKMTVNALASVPVGDSEALLGCDTGVVVRDIRQSPSGWEIMTEEVPQQMEQEPSPQEGQEEQPAEPGMKGIKSVRRKAVEYDEDYSDPPSEKTDISGLYSHDLVYNFRRKPSNVGSEAITSDPKPRYDVEKISRSRGSDPSNDSESRSTMGADEEWDADEATIQALDDRDRYRTEGTDPSYQNTEFRWDEEYGKRLKSVRGKYRRNYKAVNPTRAGRAAMDQMNNEMLDGGTGNSRPLEDYPTHAYDHPSVWDQDDISRVEGPQGNRGTENIDGIDTQIMDDDVLRGGERDYSGQ